MEEKIEEQNNVHVQEETTTQVKEEAVKPTNSVGSKKDPVKKTPVKGKEFFQEIIAVPSDVQVSLNKGIFLVKGPKGEVSKNIFNPIIKTELNNNQIILTSNTRTKRSKKIIYTYIAHLKNTFKGVTQGHVYKLKICSGHFPMTVAVKGNTFEIKNFIGEKVPRTIPIKEGVSVKVDGDIIVVEGVNKEQTGQMAASIEQLTKRPGFDKRIFQDGIYLTEKDGKEIK